MRRRTFLIAAVGALGTSVLAACTPQPRPTRSPSPTPSPTATTQPPASAVPQPASMLRSRWSVDPFALGAASFAAVGATSASRDDLAAAVDDRVFFAGEATSRDAPGTVSGAIDSGSRAADEVISASDGSERIGVIGAGVAGLTAARALLDAGYDVVVVEARDRVGGRIDARTGGSWPLTVDLGPTMIADGDEALHSAVVAAGGDVVSFGRADEVRTAAGTAVAVSGVGAAAVADAVEWSSQQPHDVPLSFAIGQSEAGALSTTPDEAGVSDADWLSHQLDSVVQPRTSATDERLSAWNGGATTPGDGVGGAIPLAGFGTLADELADGVDVLLRSVVTRVVTRNDKVSLRLRTGESLTVDRVIVTLPLGVLKSGSVVFEPELPLPKARAVSILGMGDSDRVWLRFDEPFWSTDATVWSTIAAGSPVGLWVNLLPDTGYPVLVGTVAAAEAARLAAIDDDATVLAELLASLEPFLDEAKRADAEGTGTATPTPTPSDAQSG
ncbi:NAD(P)/FAD-dependent oxidoreductase [Orlajensenia leifsoniae]|uniref:FAD-dependent oxidoreductase n=1 Tax=Orlajensenia leifsoniae TaxID=2561933 RepID=A0A4Y9QXU1_9MICO|nr:NAD(P)/FAD-dependent oxidoreductase [Leifsonia flava]TFV96678.1 FAD-dependent oxidoreductase [Leifsonia flava]